LIIRFVKTRNKYPREVPIIPGLMYESISATLTVRNAAWPEEPAVFMYDGHRMSTVGDAWDKACVRAGHAGLLFHDLRRSANKNMRDRGISQGVRMQIMGHRTASMDLPYGIGDLGDIADARQKLSPVPAKRKGVESIKYGRNRPCLLENYASDRKQWSRQQESNLRPSDYKSDALPTELCRLNSTIVQRDFQLKPISSPGDIMDLSIPLGGIQNAEAAFDSNARSIIQDSVGVASPHGDSVDLSTAVVGLLSSNLSFMANVKVAGIEDNLTQNEISLLG